MSLGAGSRVFFSPSFRVGLSLPATTSSSTQPAHTTSHVTVQQHAILGDAAAQSVQQWRTAFSGKVMRVCWRARQCQQHPAVVQPHTITATGLLSPSIIIILLQVVGSGPLLSSSGFLPSCGSHQGVKVCRQGHTFHI